MHHNFPSIWLMRRKYVMNGDGRNTYGVDVKTVSNVFSIRFKCNCYRYQEFRLWYEPKRTPFTNCYIYDVLPSHLAFSYCRCPLILSNRSWKMKLDTNKRAFGLRSYFWIFIQVYYISNYNLKKEKIPN